MTELVCAIDVGTTAVKAACFSRSGDVHASAYLEHDVERSPDGRVEQEPAVLERAFYDAIHEACGARAAEISALAITGARATFIPVDGRGTPLSKWIIWQDQRGIIETKRMQDALGDDVYYKISGLTLSPTAVVSKAMWLRAHSPDLMQRTARLSSQPDFFLGKLGATETPIDPSMAAYFGLLDVERRDWSPELIDGAGLDASLLPPIRQPGTIVGTVDDQAARATGLEVGTPLVLAGSDCSCCMIGAGAVEPGQVVAYIGTAGGISCMVETPTRDPRRAVTCLPHTPPDSWEIEALLLSAGVAYKWYRDQLAPTGRNGGRASYGSLERTLAALPPGADGLIVLPTLNGAGAPLWDPHARGIMVGLRLDHTSANIGRAILEGVCFELRNALEALERLGAPTDMVTVTGGAADSKLWTQMQADVFGVPVRTLSGGDPTLRGAAVCAGMAAGWFEDIKSGSREFAVTETVHEPAPANTAVYNDYFSAYKAIQTTLATEQLNNRIAHLPRGNV